MKHYDLCWDCFFEKHDFYMDQWYEDKAGHTVPAKKCEVCGKEDK